MKTFPLFASLLLCSSAFAAKLEGSLAVRQEILEGIRWEEKQCERSALVSGELLRLNHEDEDLIHARIAERMSACEARAARRESRLDQIELSARTIPLTPNGSIDFDQLFALLDQGE